MASNPNKTSASKTNVKGDLLSDLAGQLLSNSGLDLEKLMDAAGDKLPELLQKKNPYPLITTANWKKICDRFQRNVPANINKKWIADALGISQATAEKSILPALELMGLVTSKGKSTDRAQALGSEANYARVCKNILKSVYPDELLEMDISTKTGQNKATAWLKKATGETSANANRMAAFYFLLVKDSEERTTMAVSSKTTKEKKPVATKTTDKPSSFTVKLDFPNKSQAQKFDELLTALAAQVHAKVEKME
jgi:hypothetical protein